MYTSLSYIEQLNLDSEQRRVSDNNQRAFVNYEVAVRNWASNGSVGPPPAAPAYTYIDIPGFEAWWSIYTASLGNPPPATYEHPVAILPPPPTIQATAPTIVGNAILGDFDGGNIWASTLLGRLYPNGAGPFADPTGQVPGMFTKVVQQEPMGVVHYWQRITTTTNPGQASTGPSTGLSSAAA